MFTTPMIGRPCVTCGRGEHSALVDDNGGIEHTYQPTPESTATDPVTFTDSEAPNYRMTVGLDGDEVMLQNTWGDLDEPDTMVSVTLSREDAARLVEHLQALLAA